MMSITFSDPTDPIFAQLATAAMHWSSSELFIDDKSVDLNECVDILSCYFKKECNGICGRERGVYFPDSAKNMIASISKQNPWQGQWMRGDADPEERHFYSFLTELAPNRFELNKGAMYNKIMEDYELECLVCDKFSKNVISAAIEKLPGDFEAKERDSTGLGITYFDDVGSDEDLNENIVLARMVAEEIAPVLAKAIGSELRDVLREIILESQKSAAGVKS